ncbi:MAG: polymerase sigma factor SigV [Verrucomicrobiota bacterium]
MHSAPQAPTPPDDAFVHALTEAQLPLRAYCEAALGHGEDAKDAWQRTNVALWRKAAQWNPEVPFVSWALAFAKFEVLAVIRDRQRERVLFDSDVAELMAEAALEQTPAALPRSAQLAVCLEKLSGKQRDLLNLHYVSGLSMAEIAENQKMGLSAIKVFLLRVRRALADCIQQQETREARA